MAENSSVWMLQRALLGDDDVVGSPRRACGRLRRAPALDRIEVQAAAFEMVEKAPGRTDDDVGAMFEAGLLRADRRPADQRQDLDVVHEARQAADFLGDLVGQFARRAKHRACTAKRRGLRFVSSGSVKAAVLLPPVLACAIRSLPASVSGRLAAWIGVIVR